MTKYTTAKGSISAFPVTSPATSVLDSPSQSSFSKRELEKKSSSALPHLRRRPRKDDERSVSFATFATVHTVENTCQDWSPQEKIAVWYTQQDIASQRRTASRKAETMFFYSDDDLMDRFGVLSMGRQQKRSQFVAQVIDCVLELQDRFGVQWVVREEADTSARTATAAVNSDKSTMKHVLDNASMGEMMDRYCMIAHICSIMAIKRAIQMEKHVATLE